jgi:hypothetical protein
MLGLAVAILDGSSQKIVENEAANNVCYPSFVLTDLKMFALPAFLDLKGAIRRRDVLGIVGPHSRQPRVGDAQLQKQVSLER